MSPDRDELRSFTELLRETEVLAKRYATKHGVAALKRIVDELPPFTNLSRPYVAAVEEQTMRWKPLDLLDELADFAASYVPEEHTLTHARIRTARTRIYEALKSCSPAPPPSVSAAGETSSGGERCTVGGAGSCCLPMILYRAMFPVPTRVKIKKYIEDEGVELPVEMFCRWCGTQLDKET